MKKSFKILILSVLPLLLLTGCGKWEEDKKQYSDILATGVECVYSPSDKYNKDVFGINTIKFSADDNGLFIKFNSDAASTIYGPNGYKEKHSFNKNQFRIAQNVTQDFLNYYLEGRKCPEKIYIDKLQKHFSLEIISSFTEPIEYELGVSTVSTPDNEGKTCHASLAEDCKKFEKKITECSESGQTIYIEYGYYSTGKKYFGIAGNDNFTDFRMDENEEDGFSVMYGSKKSNFMIKEEAINDIWKAEKSLISVNEIVVSCDKDIGRKYYISGNNSIPDEGGVVVDNGTTQETKNRDTYVPSESINNSYVPTHSCTSLLGDPSVGMPNPSPAYLLTYVFKIIRYIALIILVVLSTMDFISSVSSQDKDSINKAVNKTIQRAIICVIIFLLPSIIEFVLTFLNDRAVNICINY